MEQIDETIAALKLAIEQTTDAEEYSALVSWLEQLTYWKERM